MNLCEALAQGKKESKAIRREEWAINLAWYHGMDNAVCWYNSDPNSEFIHKTGQEVKFAIADFWYDDYVLHSEINYHGDLGKFLHKEK